MRFTVVLYHDAETNTYEAVVPALPNCVTFGASIEEALAMAQDAAELAISALVDAGEEIPGATEAAVVAAIDVRVPVAA
jgi:predicted RNase H-like HicB family nuclease